MFAGGGQFSEKFNKYKGFFSSYKEDDIVKTKLDQPFQANYIATEAERQTDKLAAVQQNIEALPKKLTKKGRQILRDSDTEKFLALYNAIRAKIVAINKLANALEVTVPGIGEQIGLIIHSFKKRMLAIEAKVRRESIDVLYEVKEENKRLQDQQVNRIMQYYF